jgi:O-antigen/teichoic acid export membrane protein
LKKKLRADAILTLGAQFAIQLVGLITGVLAARYLGPSGRGELATVIVWVTMIVYVGNLGLPVAYTYAAAREPERIRQGKPLRPSSLLCYIFVFLYR